MKFDYVEPVRAKRLNKFRVGLVATLVITAGLGMVKLITQSGAAEASVGELPTTSAELRPQPEPIIAPAPSASAALADQSFDGVIQSAVTDALDQPVATEWTTVTVQKGQTLSEVFGRLGLDRQQLGQVLALRGDAKALRKLNVGDELHIKVSGESLDGLTYALDGVRTLEIRRGDNGLEAVTLSANLEQRQFSAAGAIRSSLFVDGRKAGLSPKQIYAFAKLFEYDVDFGQDLQPGDRFAVVTEELYAKGKKVKAGDILAAEFVNRGKVYRAVRFTNSEGVSSYYTPQGQSLRKGFIRNPVDFVRISSQFNPHRRHPILHVIRAHKGVDYAASTGTPIMSTGDGTLVHYGKKSGYGNVAIVRHRGGVETLYAHLSRFRPGLRVGSRVNMGQVIGYVGMSGLATAPHLHYEFRIDGIHKNPQTVSLPRADPVPQKQMAKFRMASADMVAALGRAGTKLAKAK